MTTVAIEVCRHHWILGEPQQEIILGVCKLCGMRREYPARLEDTNRFFDHEELILEDAGMISIYRQAPEE